MLANLPLKLRPSITFHGNSFELMGVEKSRTVNGNLIAVTKTINPKARMCRMCMFQVIYIQKIVKKLIPKFHGSSTIKRSIIDKQQLSTNIIKTVS